MVVRGGSMKKVLVVDDDPALADLIAEFCQGAGFEAKTVNSGRDAVQLAMSWKPHLITLDLEMPGLTGVDVLRELQNKPDTRRIPVVVISVVAKTALEEGLLRGVQTVFEKPLSFQRLMEHLSDLMSSPTFEEKPTRPDVEVYPQVFA